MRIHNVRAMRAAHASALLAALLASVAQASPFVVSSTEPAETVELKTSIEVKTRHDDDTWSAPKMELAIPIAPDVELSFSSSYRTLRLQGEAERAGLGDSGIASKWKLVHEAPGRHPAIAIEPELVLPTGDERDDLGDGHYGFVFPVIVGATFGRVGLSGQATYQHSFSPDGDEVELAVLTTLKATPDVKLGVELAASAPADDTSATDFSMDLGFKWGMTEAFELQGIAGTSLHTAEPGHITRYRLVGEYHF